MGNQIWIIEFEKYRNQNLVIKKLGSTSTLSVNYNLFSTPIPVCQLYDALVNEQIKITQFEDNNWKLGDYAYTHYIIVI